MGIFLQVFRVLSPKEKTYTIINFALRVLMVGFDLIGIILIGAVVSLVSGTIISPNSNMGKLLSWLNETQSTAGYLILAAVAISFFIFKAALSIWLTYVSSKFVAGIESSRASELISNIVRSNLEDKSKFGDEELLNSLGKSLNSTFAQSINSVSIIVGELALLVTVAGLLLFTNPVAFLSIAAFFIFVGLSMGKGLGLATSKTSNRSHDSNVQSQGVLIDILKNFRQVATSPFRLSFVDKFNRQRKILAQEAATYATLITLPRYITEIAVMLGVALLVLQRDESSTFGLNSTDIAIFLAGIFRIVASMLPLQSALSTLRNQQPEAELTLRIYNRFGLDLKKEKLSENECEHLGYCKEVCISNLHYAYDGSKEPLFRGITLEVPAGAMVAITGVSGSGKSTLADLILGLRKPSAGSVKIRGHLVGTFASEHQGRVSYVPQDSTLISGSLLENITFNVKQDTPDNLLLKKAIEVSQLSSVISRLPDGLETQFRGSGNFLSGGEVQRVGIARAIYSGAKIIVMDEVTSALDFETEMFVNAAFQKLKGEYTLLVIAHRLSTLEIADYEWNFEHGIPKVKKLNNRNLGNSN